MGFGFRTEDFQTEDASSDDWLRGQGRGIGRNAGRA